MADTQAITEQVKDQVKQGTQQAVQQGQQYAGQAVDLVTARVKSALTEQKDHLSTGITDVAQLLKQNSESFRTQGIGVYAAPYIDQAVGRLTEIGTTIQNKDIDEVIRDTEDFARVQPAVFLGIAATLGFFAARFIKSSSQAVASA
jgi:ElaB/YqjD/DUF883 family membrane-anchored ribosome-binding protein